MPFRRDEKLTLKDVVLALTLGGGMLFWLYAILLFVGLSIGRLEIRAVEPPAVQSRP